jgi:hypothetical protein
MTFDEALEEVGLYPRSIFDMLIRGTYFDQLSVVGRGFDEFEKLPNDQKYRPLPDHQKLDTEKQWLMTEVAKHFIAQEIYEERTAKAKNSDTKVVETKQNGQESAIQDWGLAGHRLVSRLPLNVYIPTCFVPPQFNQPIHILRRPAEKAVEAETPELAMA